MTIKITVRELFDKGLWLAYCKVTGTNEWAVNECLLQDNDEVELTSEQAKDMGLLGD